MSPDGAALVPTGPSLTPARTREVLRGYGMNDRFGPVLGAFSRRYLDEIPYPEDMAARIRDLDQLGTVVYVHRAQNAADHLALASASYRMRLPVARYIGGLDVTGYQPWWRFPRQSRPAEAPVDNALRQEWLLRACVQNDLAAQLFLRRPLTLFNPKTAHAARYVETLIELQRTRERPIFLVPHFLALRSEPGNFEPTAADAVFGTPTEPGMLRAFARLMLSRGLARWEVSEPINLKEFVDAHRTQSSTILAKKVRWAVLHHLARIERIAHGPPLKSPARMRDEVMQDPLLKSQIEAHAKKKTLDIAVVEKDARKIYDEIASRPDFDWARVLDKFFRFVWRIIYDAIEVEQEDLARVRQAARLGPVVLVPSHRSHVDYIVVSQAFLWNGLLPPHTAAGVNLDFFPFGPVMRRMGAYFIRRSFKGDALYTHVFRAYVRKLYREGFTQEFFIEGTRSRTGKTLPPKLGMLSMLVDAFVESKQDDAIFVPSSISYEKLIESRSYIRELGGGEKQKETAFAMVKTAGVLTSKYGRVFLTFADPISIAGFLKSRGQTKEQLQGADGEEARRRVVRDLAHEIIRGINDAVVVSANALLVLVLFGYRRRGLSLDVLEDTANMALRLVKDTSDGKVRISRGLTDDPQRALRAALDILLKDGKIIREVAAEREFYRIHDDAFLELDFYKNNVLHWFVSEAILASAMRSMGAVAGAPVSRRDLMSETRALSRVLKLEFVFEDGDFASLFAETIGRAVRYGVLTADDESVTLNPTSDARRWGLFCANLIANFLDSYWSVGAHLKDAAARGGARKGMVARLLETARADFLSGAISCREAVSKANIENAVALYSELRILHEDADGARVPDEKSAELANMLALLKRARTGASGPTTT